MVPVAMAVDEDRRYRSTKWISQARGNVIKVVILLRHLGEVGRIRQIGRKDRAL